MIAMAMQTDYPVKTICDELDLPRSTFYHTRAVAADCYLKAGLLDLAGQYPPYSYRHLSALLKRAGWTVNHKSIQRTMAEMGLQRPVKRRKMRTTNGQHGYPSYLNLVVELKMVCPDQVLVADIIYVHLARDFVYLAVIMNMFNRCVRLASEPFAGSRTDLDRPQTGTGRSCAGYSP